MRYLMLLIIIITANLAWAVQVPQIILPEKEFIVFDVEIVNNETTVNDGGTVYIDATPTMPDIVANIKPAILKMEIKYVITYTGNARNDSRPYQTGGAVNTWHVDYGGEFHGGEASVTARSEDKFKTKGFHIRGLNPAKETVKLGLDIYQQVVIYKESYPKWSQFTSNGFPIFGPPDGWGMMQLDPPPNETVIWNWLANRTAGCNILSEKYSSGLGYPSRLRAQGYTQARDWISDQERWTEGFQLYNGGHAYKWVLDIAPADPENPTADEKAGPGSWQPNPASTGYGVDAWNIKTNVENGNSPSGW